MDSLGALVEAMKEFRFLGFTNSSLRWRFVMLVASIGFVHVTFYN
uniref:Uncharacterized protein n=1 Tax=Fagus sylvatica TaxID=28930 RepID=A0A2N9FYE7_FAGSY